MPILFVSATLLAQSNPLEMVHRYLNRSLQWSDLFYIFALLAGIATLWGSIVLWERRNRTATPVVDDVQPLLQQLFTAHQLSAGEVALMLSQSEHQKLADPAMLLIDPRLWGTNLSPKSPEHSLCLKLFGQRVLEAASLSATPDSLS